MKKFTSVIQMLSLVLGVSITLAGCQKKRDAELPYGADRELLAISSYEGQDYPLTTEGLLKKSQTSSQYKIEDQRSDSKSRVKNFDFVEYKAQDPLKLTDNTMMLGRPNTTDTYKVRYVFDGDLLKVMKVAKSEDLATDEAESSVDAGKGLRMVPIVSYSVTFFSMDSARNERNEKTSRLELVGQQSRGASTHFKVNLNSKTRAVFLSKATVLPANYFTENDSSDWYYSMTVVSQNYKEQNNDWLGYLVSMDKYGREATKVRARKVEDKIIFYNVGIDDRLSENLNSRQELQSAAITLAADFIDYRLTETGKTTTVKEESHKEQAWDKRKFVDLKLKETKIPGLDLEISEIKDVQIDDGYFSVLVQSEKFGGLVRFSLLNAKHYQKSLMAEGAKPYQRKVYFGKDQELFGFFKTTQESLSTFDRSKTTQKEQLVFVNRFNPTRPTVEFRLNHSAPDWTEEIVIRSAAAWNATFKAAGSPIRIRVLDEKTGKVLRGYAGDLRYSLINMYSDVDGAGSWGGLGPSLADSQTGEIIMATSNMNVITYVNGMESTLNQFLLASRGLLDQKYVLGIPLPSLQAVQDTATKTISMIGNVLGFKKLVQLNVLDPKTKSFVKGSLPYYDQQSRKIINDMKFTTETKNRAVNLSNQVLFENRFEMLNGNIQQQVKEVCPDLFAQSQRAEDEATDVSLIKKCAIELAKPILISVTLHEMGHNFGLRHNFYGSTDYKNFFQKTKMKVGQQDVETQWRTSTVMDYLSLNYMNMTQPGLYDIAAIRWGYQDSLEDASGQVVKVNTAQSTVDQMKGNIRKYKYCTDENVDVFQVDPLCARHDTGMSPSLTKEEVAKGAKEPNRILEVVEDHIRGFETSVAVHNNRMGKDAEKNMQELAMQRVSYFTLPMKQIYDQWRFHLGNVAGNGNEYLEKFDTEEKYNALVQKALDPKIVGAEQARLNAQYKEAADRIFEFFTYMAFVPDYSCIAKKTVNGKETVRMYSFSKIQNNLHSASNGYTAKNCQDPQVHNFLKTQYDASVIAEGGYSFDNIYSDLSRFELADNSYRQAQRPEVVGIAQDRVYAMMLLTGRFQTLKNNELKNLYPNFMDEKPFKDYMMGLTTQRLDQGALMSYFGVQGAPVPSFEAEKPLLSMMMDFIRQGLFIPGKENETVKNVNSLRIVPYYFVDQEDPTCTQIFGMRFCAVEPNGMAANLMKSYGQVQQLKFSGMISNTFDQELEKFLSALIPEKFEDLEARFFFDLSESLQQMENKEMAGLVATVASQILEKEIQLVTGGVAKKINKLNQEDISKKELDAKLEEIKKIKVKDLVTFLGVEKEYTVPMTRKLMIENAKKVIAAIKANKAAYEADKTEIDAKADILLQAISGNISSF